jgi:hypothetical protein
VSRKAELGSSKNQHERLVFTRRLRRARYRGGFAYIDGVLPDGQVLLLCRLRYAGSAGLCDLPRQPRRLQDSFLPTASMGGSPEDALDTACGLYLQTPPPWT